MACETLTTNSHVPVNSLSGLLIFGGFSDLAVSGLLIFGGLSDLAVSGLSSSFFPGLLLRLLQAVKYQYMRNESSATSGYTYIVVVIVVAGALLSVIVHGLYWSTCSGVGRSWGGGRRGVYTYSRWGVE